MEPTTREKTTMEKLSVPIAIVLAGGLIGVALYFSNNKLNSESVKVPAGASSATEVQMRPVTSSDHILGNPNADILIVEYSDTECPYCKQFNTTLHRIIDEYGADGKVAWVYRHFPIDSLHPKARKEAEATECVNELGGASKFWQYLDLIYQTTNSNNSLDPAQLPKLAQQVGVDVTAFNTCLSSGKYADKVEADYQDAIKAGGQGTPTSILITKDGTKTPFQGAQPYENLKAVIDALLAS
jgi:protein-disulfide isomerase